MEQVNDILSLRRHIDRILDIHRVFVLRLEEGQDIPHIRHQLCILHQPVAGGIEDRLAPPPLPEPVLCLPVMGEKQVLLIGRKLRPHFLRGQALYLSGGSADPVDEALGILEPVGCGVQQESGGRVQGHDAGIGAGGAVYCGGPQPGNETEHPRLRVFHPHTVGAHGIADTGSAGHEQVAMPGSGHSLHQQGHLFVHLLQTPAFPVIQGGQAHGAGVNGPDRLFKNPEPLFHIPGAGAEDRLVFPGKGIAEAILQDRTGPHDHGVAAIIVQQRTERALHPLGKLPLHDLFGDAFRQGEVARLRFLFDLQIPEAVVHDIGIKDVGADVEGIVRLDAGEDVRAPILRDLPG